MKHPLDEYRPIKGKRCPGLLASLRAAKAKGQQRRLTFTAHTDSPGGAYSARVSTSAVYAGQPLPGSPPVGAA